MALALSALAAFAQDAMISPEAPTTIALPGGERVEQAGQPNKINSDQRWLGLYTTDALGQFGRGFPEYPGDNKVARCSSPIWAVGWSASASASASR